MRFVESIALVLALLVISDTRMAAEEIRFTEVTQSAGLIDGLAGIMGHGGAWGDIDNDGDLDLYVGGFGDRPNAEYRPASGPVANQLFINNGNGTFHSAKQSAVELFGRTSGAVFADLDNNGSLELYVANNARDRSRAEIEPQKSATVRRSNLFQNKSGSLIDISSLSGACTDRMLSARNVGVFDYDQDGLLDLLIVEDKFTRMPRTTLYRNLGNLKFQDVNALVGLPDGIHGLGLAVADLNGDLRPDFFVGHSNRMFLSRPDGQYFESDDLNSVFAWKPLNGEDWPCGAVFGDLNRDDRQDLVVALHHVKARNRIYLNLGIQNGIPKFRDVTEQVGLPPEISIRTPHVEIQDFDNDGWPDLYFSAAWMTENGRVTPIVFRNTGVRQDRLPNFVPLRPIMNLDKLVYFPAGPSGDYDNDGRVDLFLINWFQGNHCRLLRNESPVQNWLNVRIAGKTLNRMGIGTQIRVYKTGSQNRTEGLLGSQELSIGYGYASGQAAISHFGLGALNEVDLSIQFSNGKKLEQKNVKSNQSIVIEEP